MVKIKQNQFSIVLNTNFKMLRYSKLSINFGKDDIGVPKLRNQTITRN